MDVQSIILPEELTISCLSEFKPIYLEIIDTNDTIVIDDSQVLHVDTLGVQFFLSLVNYAATLKKPITWKSNSFVLKTSIKKLGIDSVWLEQVLNKNALT